MICSKDDIRRIIRPAYFATENGAGQLPPHVLGCPTTLPALVVEIVQCTIKSQVYFNHWNMK